MGNPTPCVPLQVCNKIYKKRITKKSTPSGFIIIGVCQLCCGLDTLPNILNIKFIIRNWSGRLWQSWSFQKKNIKASIGKR